MARKKPPPATSSIDATEARRPAPLRFTLPLDRVQGLDEQLAASFGVADGPSALARLVDPRFVEERLARASPIALGVLEILVDFEGLVHRDVLDRVVVQRLGVEPKRVESAVECVFTTGLAAPIVAQMPYESRKQRFAMLLAESSGTVAAAVRGLSLPGSEPDAALTVGARRPLRDYVAFVAALAHVAVRATSTDLANRASTKKLGALLGLEAHPAADRVDDAVYSGLAGVRNERLVPRVDALRALVAGEATPADADQEWIATRMPEDRWIPIESLAREMARVEHVRSNAPYFDRFGVALALAAPDFPRLESVLRNRPWLVVAEHAGVLWVRRWPKGGSDSGDGHVTPAFEVMLGPDADPRLTLEIALAAEPVRFDTVLTFKLTPASVAAALSLGLDAPRILAALDRVGRHPVPDNVRLMIGDWARSIRTASLRKAWVVETNSPEAADAAARALGGHLLARPTPTTLLVDEALTSPGAMLGKASVHVEAEITRSPRSKRPGSVVSAPLAIPTPSPALRARFAAERSSKHGLSVPSATPIASRTLAPVRGARLPESLSEIADLDAFLPDIEDGDETAPSDVLGALLEQVDDPGAYEVIDRLADRWLDLEDVIINWASRRGGRIGDDALERASREPWAFLPLLVMNASAQRRIVRDARSTDEMITRARKLVEEGVAVEEPELFERASSPEVQRLFGVESKADAAPASGSPSSVVGEQRVQGAEAIHEAFTRAIERGASVTLRVHSKTQGERRLHLRPERVLTRGADVTLLGTELGTELGRSFPLANVRELVIETG